MNNQPLSHDDTIALLTGSPSHDRPDLVALAAAIDDFRDAFAEPAPQPSPELFAWLTSAPAQPQYSAESTTPTATPVRARTGGLKRRIRAATRTLAGLGVTAKLTFGATAALAAVASAGAVGVLPEGPQAVFDRILDNNHPDVTLPRGPVDEPAKSGTRADPRSEAGAEEQRHTEQRPPRQTTSEPQADGSDDRSPDATSDLPRGGSHPVPDSIAPNDSDDSDNERHDDPGNEPDDGPGHESDEESDDQSEDADDGSQADDAEEADGSSDDAADGDGSSESSDDADDVDAETEEASSN